MSSNRRFKFVSGAFRNAPLQIGGEGPMEGRLIRLGCAVTIATPFLLLIEGRRAATLIG